MTGETAVKLHYKYLPLIVLCASGLKATYQRGSQGKATKTNKQCEKVILQQDSNLQPLDHRSTTSPLELEKMSLHRPNFDSLKWRSSGPVIQRLQVRIMWKENFSRCMFLRRRCSGSSSLGFRVGSL